MAANKKNNDTPIYYISSKLLKNHFGIPYKPPCMVRLASSVNNYHIKEIYILKVFIISRSAINKALEDGVFNHILQHLTHKSFGNYSLQISSTGSLVSDLDLQFTT